MKARNYGTWFLVGILAGLLVGIVNTTMRLLAPEDGGADEAIVDAQPEQPADAKAGGGARGEPADLSKPLVPASQARTASAFGGLVLQPNGRPAAGATVTLFSQQSAWPEWRRETVEAVTTGANGMFAFASPLQPGLLVGFEHPDFAGDVREAPAVTSELELQLQPGFSVEGVVTNDAGLPVGNVRVSLESPLAEERALRTEITGSSGRFRFRNVAPGALRVVARHDLWQPATLPNVVVGEVLRSLELRFSRPALAFEGRVVSAASQDPVADAVVLAMPPVQRLGRNQPATARSGPDGRFRVAGLASGVHRFEVRHPSFGMAARTVAVGPGAAQLAFDLPQRASVRGRIVGEGGPDLAGAWLELRSAADELLLTTVQQDGSFTFAGTVTPGLASLSVADGRFAFDSGARVVQVKVEESAAPLELRAMHPAVVVGRVVDEAGAPLRGANIKATEAGMLLERLSRAGSALLDRDIGKLGDQLTRSTAGAPQPLLAVTGDDGAFRIAGLPPGSTTLRVERPGFGSKLIEATVPTCGETASVEDVAMPVGCSISGRVRRGGRLVAGVQVGVVVEGVAVTSVTGPDGRYELRSLPPGNYRVAARYATFPTVRARDAANLASGGEATIDLDLPQGRTIRGVVTGTDGQPVEGALVLLRGEQVNPVVTDSNGAFELEAPNRDVALVVGQFDRSSRRTVDVPARQSRVEIRIDAARTGAITARIAGLPGRAPLPGVLLRITRIDSESMVSSRWFDLDGGVLRNPLFPAGRSRVVFWSEGYAPVVRELNVRAGEDADLGEIVMEPGSELRGVVRDETGEPVAGAEVFLGDESDLFEYQSPLRTAEDGTFRVRGVSSAAANLLVRASGFAYSSTSLRLPDDVLGLEPLVVELERGSTIEAFVRDPDAEGSMVVLRRGLRIVATAEIDENGVAVFANRSPGAYSLQLYGDDRTRVTALVTDSGDTVRVDL